MSKFKIIACVSHMDEKTLDYCIERLKNQTIPLIDIKVFSNITPMCNSFNACLDYAYENNADLLFHTAADVIPNTNALEILLNGFNIDKHFLSVVYGFDIFNLDTKYKYKNSSVGIWMFNMRVFKNIYRFKDEFIQDVKLMKRIEETTKLSIFRNMKISAGYHHPIWTVKEIFLKFIYSSYKYKDSVVKNHLFALKYWLKNNPHNKVLLLGKIILEDRLGPKKFYIPLKSKNNIELEKYYQTWKKNNKHIINIENDDEYFVAETKFKEIAMKLYNNNS